MRYPLLLATTAMTLLAALLFAVKAPAHDWYPLSCCSGQDCAPVRKVEMVAGATYANALNVQPGPIVTVVTTQHGSVAVPANFPRKPSPDGQMHACMRRDSLGVMQLICLFWPPSI